MSDGADLEYLVLSLLGQAQEPVGSGAVCDWLRKHGNTISEATVGRFLRELDFRGLTQREGFRGRILSEAGQVRWAELQREKAMTRSSRDLMRALSAGDLDQVVDVLVARRALEREIARLAALRATERDVAALEELLARYEATSNAPAAAEADFAFHVRLAEVTGNRVLQATTRLIHSQAQTAMIPPAIHRRLKLDLTHQHRAILDAIRAKDPERAENAMIAHIDDVINAIRKYGQIAER